MNVRRRKVLLRLDDGSLIGPSFLLGGSTDEPIRLPVDRALQINRVSQKDLERLEKHLATAQQLGLVIPRTTAFQTGSQTAKKARLDTVHAAGGHDLAPKYLDLLRKIYAELGTNKDIFYKPVDARLVPDYYTVVKSPITLGQIEDRVKRRQYSIPEEFSADVRLVWANCKLYNPEGDPFRKMGERAEEHFEFIWAASGLCLDARGKRATAGVAAPKYEPELPMRDLEAPAKPKGSGASKKPAAGRYNEVSSGGGLGRAPRPLSEERRNEIATQLQDLPEQHMEDLMALLPPHMLEGADGEFELDFEALDDGTLRKIDVFLRAIQDATMSPPSQGAGRVSAARIDPDTSEGEEEEEEESDPDSD